jgi:hypothetical protein
VKLNDLSFAEVAELFMFDRGGDDAKRQCPSNVGSGSGIKTLKEDRLVTPSEKRTECTPSIIHVQITMRSSQIGFHRQTFLIM